MLQAMSDFALPMGNIFNLNRRRAFLSTHRQQLWVRELLRSWEAVSCPVSDGLLAGRFQQRLVGRAQGWDLQGSGDVLLASQETLLKTQHLPWLTSSFLKWG